MKMVLAVYNQAVDSDVMDAVKKAGVQWYTQWPHAIGVGEHTGPRLDDHIWPGANTVLMMVVGEDQAGRVMEALRTLRQTVGQTEGLSAFLLHVEGQL